MTGQPVTNPDLWLGKPHPDTLLKFEEVLGTADLTQVSDGTGHFDLFLRKFEGLYVVSRCKSTSEVFQVVL
jgi:hypothetical protein